MNLDGFALPVKKLKGTDPVTSLDLSRKGLGVASAVVIGALIGANTALTSLDVSYNMLDRSGHGVKMLRDAVRGRQGFTLLDGGND